MVTGSTFVDFKRAFDVTNHELLLKKFYEANDITVKWFRSYLSYVRVLKWLLFHQSTVCARCFSRINLGTSPVPCVSIMIWILRSFRPKSVSPQPKVVSPRPNQSKHCWDLIHSTGKSRGRFIKCGQRSISGLCLTLLDLLPCECNNTTSDLRA